MFFKDRSDAGQKLSEVLTAKKMPWQDFEVIGVARGGVIIAAEIAKVLGLPLQAICEEDIELFDKGEYVNLTSLGSGIFYRTVAPRKSTFMEDITQSKNIRLRLGLKKLKESELLYNCGRSLQITKPKVLVCDDGLVSGKSARTVLQSIKATGRKEVILAVPVVPGWLKSLKLESFNVLTWRVSTIENPTTGVFYSSFEDVSDKEVIAAVKSC